jgi:hypothetical protein
MSKRWVVPLGGLLVVGGVCSGCLWSVMERLRFSQSFDIGGGRTLRVWSIRRGILDDLSQFTDPNPLLVYYRVESRSGELVRQTFLEHDDEGEYEFRSVTADGGRLACVYEVTRAANNFYFLLMYDAESRESWPRVRDDETNQMPGVVAKWRERYRRLKAEHPELPAPEPFGQ